MLTALVHQTILCKGDGLNDCQQSSPIKSVISLDASPAHYTHSHGSLLRSMLALDLRKITNHHQAMNQLFEAIPDKATCAFACTNLVKKAETNFSDIFLADPTEEESEYMWRSNLPVLLQQELHVHAFPLAQCYAHFSPHLLTTVQELGNSGKLGSFDDTFIDDLQLRDLDVIPFKGPMLFIGGNQSSRLTTPEYLTDLKR